MKNSNADSKNHKYSESIKDSIEKLSLELSELSYENSIKELDSILNKLQAESLLVEELQLNYLKANLYLEHCEKLLENTKQEIIEINDISSFRNE